MSIASEYNAAKDYLTALLEMENPNATVRAIASVQREEAFQRMVKARARTNEGLPSIDFRGEVPALRSALMEAV